MQAPMTIKQYVSQMKTIPGGRFTMGRTYEIKVDPEAYNSELPAHLVDLTSFRLGASLVTVGMWREYVRANKHLSMPEVPAWDWIDDHPIVNVSWNDIMGVDGLGGYCEWASRVGGLRLSLPSEAQWEYAAKGGKLDRKYPWGNTWDHDKLWCSSRETRNRTAPVIRTNNVYVNTFGLLDMAGNANQWCFDTLTSYTQTSRDRLGYSRPVTNPREDGSGLSAVRYTIVRGGWWGWDDPVNFRCALRGFGGPDYRDNVGGCGFRLVAGPK